MKIIESKIEYKEICKSNTQVWIIAIIIIAGDSAAPSPQHSLALSLQIPFLFIFVRRSLQLQFDFSNEIKTKQYKHKMLKICKLKNTIWINKLNTRCKTILKEQPQFL